MDRNTQKKIKHLATIFDPAQGRMGDYMRLFMDHALTHPDITEIIKNKVLEKSQQTGDFITAEKERFQERKILWRDFTDVPNNENLEELHDDYFFHDTKTLEYDEDFTLFGLLDAPVELNHHLQSVLREALRDYKMIFSDTKQSDNNFVVDDRFCVNESGVSIEKEFQKTAKRYYRKGNDFTNDPNIIISEAIDSMDQAMGWLCMHCQSSSQLIRQMQVALKPTIIDPRNGKKVSPIEMLGYGNNGYTGNFIDDMFPTHIGMQHDPIIRNATALDSDIVHPRFVEFWFDRDLEIGGCPVLTHRQKIGEIYLDFAKMYVSLAEKMQEFKAELPIQNIQTYSR